MIKISNWKNKQKKNMRKKQRYGEYVKKLRYFEDEYLEKWYGLHFGC